MTRRGRIARAAAAAALLVGVTLGTLWGQDDHFPFGPFRMYSTTTSDRVTVLVFDAVTTSGRHVRLPSSHFGLRPAEVHGQIARFADREELLGHLVAAYERLNPGAEPIESLSLSYGVHILDAGRPVAYELQALGRWTRP